jgi:hypothetical protein
MILLAGNIQRQRCSEGKARPSERQKRKRFAHAEAKLDSVNVSLRVRIVTRGLHGKLHVEVRRDKDNNKGVYMLHGPSPGRAKASSKK